MTGLSDEALAIKAVNAGAQDYLVKGEADGVALARRLRFAIERGRSSAQSLSAEPSNLLTTLGFLGCKGGVGASTIACYLGIALRTQTRESVLLADFDFESGVLGFLMEVEPKYSLGTPCRTWTVWTGIYGGLWYTARLPVSISSGLVLLLSRTRRPLGSLEESFPSCAPGTGGSLPIWAGASARI